MAALTDTLNGMLAALESAQRSERRFLADASHELRTPVTALRGNVEYVARHGADPEAMADLRADAERLARLVDDLLVLERQGQGVPAREPVDLSDLARAAAEGHEEVAVEVRSRAVAEGDPASLRRALDNLLANALVHGRAPVRILVAGEGDVVRLVVDDAGPGLAPGEVERGVRALLARARLAVAAGDRPRPRHRPRGRRGARRAGGGRRRDVRPRPAGGPGDRQRTIRERA